MIKENTNIRKTDVINRRMFIISAAKIIVFAGIIGRLFSLQINENKRPIIPANTTIFAAEIINIRLLITSDFLIFVFSLIIFNKYDFFI